MHTAESRRDTGRRDVCEGGMQEHRWRIELAIRGTPERIARCALRGRSKISFGPDRSIVPKELEESPIERRKAAGVPEEKLERGEPREMGDESQNLPWAFGSFGRCRRIKRNWLGLGNFCWEGHAIVPCTHEGKK